MPHAKGAENAESRRDLDVRWRQGRPGFTMQRGDLDTSRLPSTMHDMKQFLAVLSSFVVTLGHLAAQAEKSNDPVGAAWDHFNAARYDLSLIHISKAMA